MRNRKRRMVRAAVWCAAAALLLWARSWLWQGLCQVLLGVAAALLALPFAERFERRVSSGTAAALALLASGALAAALLVLLLPPLAGQLRALTQKLPELLESAGALLRRGREWLRQNGVPMEEGVQGLLLDRGKDLLDRAAPAVASWVSGVAGSVSQWMLAPVFAFYFLKDRRRISQRLWMLLPARRRVVVRRTLGEMHREVAGYLRGQLLISAAVGSLTAVGLLLCGVEAWLALGLAMGVLELIPYAGPFIGGALAVLFALSGGWAKTLWTLGVVVAVQQAEGSVLSPKLLSAATQLHPLAVILCITLGGAAAGVWGMLLSVPLLLCARAAVRVAADERIFQR